MGATPAMEAITDAVLTALRAIDGTGDYWHDLTGADAVLEADALEPTIDSAQVTLSQIEIITEHGLQMGYYSITWTAVLMGSAPESSDASVTAARQAARLMSDCATGLQRMRDSDPPIATLAKGSCIDVRVAGTTRHGDSINQDMFGGLGFCVAQIEITAEVTEGL